MNTYYNGFDSQVITFKTMADVSPKKAVALNSNGEVYYPDEKKPFTGIVSAYRNGIASVIVRGYAEVTFKNTIPSVGICKLSVGTSGNFEVDEANGTPYTVLGVDLTAKTIEIIL